MINIFNQKLAFSIFVELVTIFLFFSGNYYAFFEIVFMKDNVWNYLD